MTLTTRKLAIVLAVSVALNLFLLGFGAARMLGRGDRMHEPWAAQQFRDRGDRAQHGGPHMFQMMGPRSGAMREHLNALRQAQRAVATALTAEPFERASLEVALAQLRQRQSAAAEASHAALCDLAAKLDQPGRRALVERGRFPQMH